MFVLLVCIILEYDRNTHSLIKLYLVLDSIISLSVHNSSAVPSKI